MLKDPFKPLDKKIVIKLYKPHSGQIPIHASKARFRIVCCGRRFGKTFMACNEAIRFASKHANTLTAWISPSYKQSKMAFRLIKRALKDVAKTNDTELRIELPNGAVIAFYSAENYDALRGNGFHFVIMDESADIREAAWLEVIRPAISDTNGRVLMIGTPKGRNFFYVLFCRGNDPTYEDWESFTAPTSANPYINPAEIEAAKKEMPEDTFRQEFLAVFLEESAGVFRGIDKCIDGELDEDYAPRESHMYILGWDSAKQQDYSVVTVMDATEMSVVAWDRFNQIDYTFQIKQVVKTAEKFNAFILMDSTGVGNPLLEQVKARYPRSDGYLFTNASKKALIEKLQLGFQFQELRMPDIPILVSELRQFEYHITASRNMIYEAPAGAHDDCVISLALAFWGSSNPKIPLAGEEDPQDIPVPTIADLARYDPFAWAEEHGSWGIDD